MGQWNKDKTLEFQRQYNVKPAACIMHHQFDVEEFVSRIRMVSRMTKTL